MISLYRRGTPWWLVLGLGILIGLTPFVTMLPESVRAVIVLALLTGALLGLGLRLVEVSERTVVACWIYGGLALRLALIAGVNLLPSTSFLSSLSDISSYQLVGRAVANMWATGQTTNLLQQFTITTPGFYYVTAALYYVAGPAEWIVPTFNAVLACLNAILVYKVTKEWGGRAAIFAMVLQLFIPSLMMWSILELKDTLVITILLVGLYSGVRLKERFRFGWILAAAGAMLAVSTIRFYYALFLAAALGIGLTFGGKKMSLRRWGVALMLGVLALYLLSTSSFATRYLADLSVDTLSDQRALFSGGTSAFDAGVQFDSLSSILRFLPRGLAYVFFAPFPWQGGSAMVQVAKLETLILYCLYPAAIRGAFQLLRREKFAVGWLAFVAMNSVLYAIVVGNIGTLYRYRGPLITALVPLIALGFIREGVHEPGAKSEG